VFKPAGIPARELEVVVMALDELEALRLTDLEGLYQEQAAERMGISRATLGRILASAHRKAAEALVLGKAIRIEGGPVRIEGPPMVRCEACDLEWSPDAARAGECPRCKGRAGSSSGDDPAGEPACPRRRRRERHRV
jgi:uncharacterized protein